MAAPTYSDILAYSSRVSQLANAAGLSFAQLAAAVSFDDWGAAADELRDMVYNVVGIYGLGSSRLGAEWYEYCRALGIGGEYTAMAIQPTRAQVVGAANRAIDKLFVGDITSDMLTFELENVVTEQVRNASRETIMGNLEIEYASAKRSGKSTKKMTYARVPVGDTCAFCCMLASRGYVYGSERSAKYKSNGEKFHDGCDCEVIPFAGPRSISGYNYSKYEKMYSDARTALDKPSKELSDRLKDAHDMHDAMNERRIENGEEPAKWDKTNEILVTMRYQNPGMH